MKNIFLMQNDGQVNGHIFINNLGESEFNKNEYDILTVVKGFINIIFEQ